MRIRILLIVSMSFFGCSVLVDDIISLGMTSFPEYYMEEWEELTEYSDVVLYIRSHIEYTKDTGLTNTQSPEETMLRGKGDCEDIALLFLNIAKVGMGIEMEAVIVNYERSVETGGIKFNHVVVRYGDMVLEPQTGRIEDYTVKYAYTYQEVFNDK